MLHNFLNELCDVLPKKLVINFNTYSPLKASDMILKRNFSHTQKLNRIEYILMSIIQEILNHIHDVMFLFIYYITVCFFFFLSNRVVSFKFEKNT